MAVFQEQEGRGYRFVVRPNCAMSWRSTKYLMWAFAACFAAVGAYFASLGAWLALPFAGLELLVLVAGFYMSALAGHTREVIEIDGPVLRVMRGRRDLGEVASFPANWTQVTLWRDPRGWYPSRLVLRCHGRRLEIATKVVEAEREELARALKDWLGVGQLEDGGVLPEPLRTGLSAPARDLPAGHRVRVMSDDVPRAGTNPRISPRDKV